MSKALPSVQVVVATQTDGAVAADVVEALSDVMVERLEMVQLRMVQSLKRGVVIFVGWVVAIAAALVAWLCANIALALWVGVENNALTAVATIGVVHVLVSLLLIGWANSKALLLQSSEASS